MKKLLLNIVIIGMAVLFAVELYVTLLFASTSHKVPQETIISISTVNLTTAIVLFSLLWYKTRLKFNHENRT
jgi:hypothetical protein